MKFPSRNTEKQPNEEGRQSQPIAAPAGTRAGSRSAGRRHESGRSEGQAAKGATPSDALANTGPDRGSNKPPAPHLGVWPRPPAPLGGALRDPVRQLEEQEDRRRMQQNLAATILVLLLMVAGLWLIDHLRTSARIAACVEAGHRNCVPLEFSRTPGR